MASTTFLGLLLTFLVLQVPGCLSQLVFTDSPASTTALLYHSITLRCLASNPAPPFNILWQKDGVLLLPRDNTTTISYDSSTGAGVYTVASVIYSDAGTYQCFAMSNTGQIQAESTPGILTVQGQPVFDPATPVVAAQGSQTVLPCNVQSIPPVTSVSWSLQSQTLVSGGRILITQAQPYTLTITSVQSSDEGYYVCTAQNSFGRNTTTIRLTIGTPPPQLMLTISPSGNTVSVNEGGTLTLSCSAPEGTQLSSIQWSRGGMPLTTGVTQRSNEVILLITNAGLGNGGVYECGAVDSTGNTDTRSISVIVNVPPEFTIEPSDITVMEFQSFNPPRCSATGDPVPSISWLRPDGTTIPLQGIVPIFGTLTRSDGGTYVCVASNVAGEVRSEFEITVQGEPVFTVSPVDVVAAYGQDVSFRCEAVGPPTPTLSWSRVGGALPVNSLVAGNVLNLFSVTSSDSGMYRCVASNPLNSVSRTVVLTVQAPPMISSATSSPQYILLGSTFTLNCSFTGPSDVTLNWYLNGTLLSPANDQRLQILSNGSLVVSSPTSSYSGVYTCNVSNSATFDTAQVTVTVGEPPLITTSPSNIDLVPGSATLLSCETSGIPQPWVTWYRTGVVGTREELSVFGATYTRLREGLRLHDVTSGDSGMYECMVDNRLGTDSRTAMVRVEGPPIASGIQPTIVTAGESATLTCLTSINFPQGTVIWSRPDGATLPSRFITNLNFTLTISTVLEEDNGQIMCTVANSYGPSSVTANLMVLFAPSISLPASQATVLISNSIILSCPSTGNPTPTITWTLPGRSTLASDQLPVFSARGTDAGVYTCTAENSVGSVSAEIELVVQGPPVSSLTVRTLSSIAVISVIWTPPSFSLDLQSYDITISLIEYPDVEPIVFNRLVGSSQVTAQQGVLSGQHYQVVIQGVYLNGVEGIATSMNITTNERAPVGPPQNIELTAIAAGVYMTWELPLLEDRNGEIISYDIFYRLKPFNETILIPFEGIVFLRNDSSETDHSLTLEELQEEQTYEVMMSASTAVGPGPNSTIVEALTLRRPTYNSVNYPLVIDIVTGIAAALGGILVIVAVVIALFMFIYWARRKVKNMEGSFKPSSEEGGKKKERKSVSRPIPSIKPKIDPSDESKFQVISKDGKVLSTNPKIITEADVASPPRAGEKVKVVSREKILGSSTREDEPYQSPADALVHEEPGYDSVTVSTRKPKPRQTKPVVVESSPEPEPEAEDEYDDHDDESHLVYATVSTDHKQQKRTKMLEEQQKKELKAEKEKRKMQEKMEREQKKREEKERKAAEKERRKRAKDNALRSSMGLDNIVRLSDVDLGSQAGRAQAHFIDAATAAIF